jgi:hypothetical protein
MGKIPPNYLGKGIHLHLSPSSSEVVLPKWEYRWKEDMSAMKKFLWNIRKEHKCQAEPGEWQTN